MSQHKQNATPFFSPSKLNLFFKVLEKRKDGYHEIASLFQAIDLGDDLDITPSEQDSFTCSEPILVSDSNLVVKARDLFRAKTGISTRYSIHLTKRIPMEAGLGGGSGNAATTLWALAQLSKQGVAVEDLRKWGAELGSDISFFFSNGTAFCSGRGEKIEELPSLDRTSLWIAKPKWGLSTKAVYESHRCSPSSFDLGLFLKDFSNEAISYFNDLEETAFHLLPSLATIKTQLLESGFHTVVMTGSGTAFFCLGKNCHPNIEGVDFFNVNFIQRKEGDWYARPK